MFWYQTKGQKDSTVEDPTRGWGTQVQPKIKSYLDVNISIYTHKKKRQTSLPLHNGVSLGLERNDKSLNLNFNWPSR